jgi:hypothetical protein
LWKWSATIACVVCSALPAYGQVIRCTDAKTGEVTYTDGKCATGAVAREVEAKRTPEEIEQDRRTAERALELKQQRLQAESAAASAQSQRELEQERLRAARAANAAPAAKDYGNSAECAKSRRNLELLSAGVSRTNYDQDMRLEAAQRQMDLDCLGPQGYAELERARAAQPLIVVTPQRRPVHTPPATVPQQPYITSCSSFYCIDSTGARYPRSGPGQFPGNGGVCKSKGGQAPC